jgi:hypothetical protein
MTQLLTCVFNISKARLHIMTAEGVVEIGPTKNMRGIASCDIPNTAEFVPPPIKLRGRCVRSMNAHKGASEWANHQRHNKGARFGTKNGQTFTTDSILDITMGTNDNLGVNPNLAPILSI